MIILPLLHTGIMGGEHYNHHGGGANYLCLPLNPKYERDRNGVQGGGYRYGTEYEVSPFVGTVFKRNIHNHEAPCVVCFVKSRGSMLIMPARNDCPSGWTEAGADPGFFLGRGALVSCSTLTPINHIVLFFFAEYQLYEKTAGHLREGCAPPAPSP